MRLGTQGFLKPRAPVPGAIDRHQRLKSAPTEGPVHDTPTQSEKDRVVIFDTTVRDGEQCPAPPMTHEEKIEVAELLDPMGVDVIEAGFPIASDGDFRAVNEIAKRTKNAGRVRPLARGVQRHRPLRRGDQAGRAQAHHTVPVHLAGAHEVEAAEGAAPGARHGDRAGDARAQSCRGRGVERRGRHAHRVRVPLPLRRGRHQGGRHHDQHPGHRSATPTPEEHFEMFRKVRETVPNSDKAVFSVHCHNDLGMAVANSLAGIKAGARQIECTINGIGERAGNTALEEVVMAMRVRNDVLPYWTKIDSTMLKRASKLVAAATSFPVQYNKAIVGGTRSRTRAASTRTACSRTRRPTRS
jgi:2-isopropylmalate synthase